MDIVVLNKDEIETLVRRAAELAVAGLREELERTRTPDLMTMSQLCDYLQCHRSTIDRHIKNGMPAERFGGDPRFRKTDIDLWLRGKYETNARIDFDRSGISVTREQRPDGPGYSDSH